MYPACSNTALVNTQAEALRASYTSVQDDIRRFEHAVREDAVQTVMGRTEVTGKCNESTAKDFCIGDNLLSQLLEAHPQREAMFTRFSQVGAAISAATNEKTAKAAAELIQKDVLDSALDRVKDIQQTASDTQATAKSLANQARKATRAISSERAHAETIFDSDMKLLSEQMIVCSEITTAISGVDKDLQKVMRDASTDSSAKADLSKKYGQLRNDMVSQRDSVINGVIDHMNGHDGKFGTARKDDATDLKDLQIPRNLRDGHGQELIDSINAYTRGRGKKYHAIIPMLRRIGSDVDAVKGIYFKPPTLGDDGYADVDEIFRKIFTAQSKDLFDEIWENLDDEQRLLLLRTFQYGADRQFKFKCPSDDGISAYFALLSQFRPQNSEYRDTLEKHFEDAAEHFAQGNPIGKFDFLCTKLREVSRLGVKLRWNKTGKTVVQVLSRLDEEYRHALKDWKTGTYISDYEDCAGDIETLFNDVRTAHAEIQLADSLIGKGGKQWRSHYAGDDNRRNNSDDNSKRDRDIRECNFGLKCIKDDCWFKHPSGWSASKARSDKGIKDRTLKRSYYSDHSRREDRRGGSGCQHKGCYRSDRECKGKKFCTSCFKKGLEKGLLVCKNGPDHKFKKRNDRDNDKDSDKFGFGSFNKKQKAGIKQVLAAVKKEKDRAKMGV